MFVHADEVKEETLENGVKRSVKGYLPDLMLVEMVFMRGMVGARHSHPHRQVGYVVKGRFEIEIEGKKSVLAAGEVYYTEAGQVHGALCLEDDSVLVDVFTPHREDFLA